MGKIDHPFPPDMQAFIDQRIAQGDYADLGEYLCDLVRRDRDAELSDIGWVREEVAAGLASGRIKTDAKSLKKEVFAELSLKA